MLFDQVKEAADYIQKHIQDVPPIAIILGSGLKESLSELAINKRIRFEDIPHFPIPTVRTHGADFILGTLGGKNVIALSGRFHYYEGFTMDEVTFGIRVLGQLGIQQLIITNITGSTNDKFKIGDLVVVKDHINLQSANPLRGASQMNEEGARITLGHDDRLGPRFPSMINAYDSEMRALVLEIAREKGIPLHVGIYTSMNGPSLETPSEYLMINKLGGDIVGMSTVPEVIVAKQIGLQTCVLSIISNQCIPIEDLKEESLEDILKNVQKGVPHLRALIQSFVTKL